MTTPAVPVERAREAATRAWRESRDAQRQAEVRDALAHFNTVIGQQRGYRSASVIRWVYQHRVECAPLGAFAGLLAAGIIVHHSGCTGLIVAALMFCNGVAVLIPGRKWKTKVRRVLTLTALSAATGWIVLWAGEAFNAAVLTVGLAAGVTAYALPWFLAHRPMTAPAEPVYAEHEQTPEPVAFEALDFDLAFWQHLWSQARHGGRVHSVETHSAWFRVLTVRMDRALTELEVDTIAQHLRGEGARTVTIQVDFADPATLYAYVSDAVRYDTAPRSAPETTAASAIPGPAQVPTTPATSAVARRRAFPLREREVQP